MIKQSTNFHPNSYFTLCFFIVISPLLSSISAKNASSVPHVPEKSENKQHWNCSEQIIKEFSRNIDLRLKHQNLNLWQSLPTQHWTTLFGYYNISLSGR